MDKSTNDKTTSKQKLRRVGLLLASLLLTIPLFVFAYYLYVYRTHISIVLFFFIQVDNVAEKVILRILLMPVVAGISYEIIRLAGRTDNVFIKILSAPGMWIQRMTTREPDESMAEVAIASVEAVFDWKKYLQDTFGYEVDGSWMKDDASAEPED